jgi:hypothetical protein
MQRLFAVFSLLPALVFAQVRKSRIYGRFDDFYTKVTLPVARS